MKKVVISLLFLVLCAACGMGAFFFLREGKEQRKQELKPKPELIGLQDITIQEGEALPESVTHIKATETVDTVDADISEVNTKKVGTYSIYYSYTDMDGKTYHKKVHCTVEAKEKKEPELKRVPESGTQKNAEVTIPKTGDEVNIMSYVLLMLLSLTGVWGALYYKKSHRKI